MKLATFSRNEKYAPPVPTRKECHNLKPGDIVRLGDMFGQHGIRYFNVTISVAHLDETGWNYVSTSGIEFRPEHIREILETK